MPRSPALSTLALSLILATAASAQSPVTPVDCAAFWYGRDDYARRSKLMPRNPSDQRMAKQAEAAAIRKNGETALDEIGASRTDMALIFEASIELQDQQSHELAERMTANCVDLSATLP